MNQLLQPCLSLSSSSTITCQPVRTPSNASENTYPYLDKSTHSAFLILYLLPNDDEQRQTSSSAHGVFNEHFQFQVRREKSHDAFDDHAHFDSS